MRSKRLHTLLLSDIPELGESITSTRDELVVVERVDAQAHNVAKMIGKLVYLGASLEIPEHARHVARGCEDALVADESAAAEVSRVARQFTCHACGTFPCRQVVDGANVIETTAGNVVARGRVGTGHDPRGAKGDGVDLVCCVGIPDDQLAVLRGRDEMAAVRRPVHGVDLGEMALEGALCFHGEARQGLDAISGNIADWSSVLAVDMAGVGMQRQALTGADHVRVVSASSSFLRFIRSLRASASRRASWIFCCMVSWFMSAMGAGVEGGSGQEGRRREKAIRADPGACKERGGDGRVRRQARKRWTSGSSNSNSSGRGRAERSQLLARKLSGKQTGGRGGA